MHASYYLVRMPRTLVVVMVVVDTTRNDSHSLSSPRRSSDSFLPIAYNVHASRWDERTKDIYDPHHRLLKSPRTKKREPKRPDPTHNYVGL